VPYEDALFRLLSIPGVERATAACVIAEIGVDMSQFHGAAHLASWAGLCPGNHESAGRKRGGKARRGNVFLKAALVTAGKTRGTYYAEKYRRLCARRGKLRAAVAIGHKILVAIYHMLTDGTLHEDPGAGYLDSLDRHRTSNQLIRRPSAQQYGVRCCSHPTGGLTLPKGHRARPPQPRLFSW
jgi:transposase